MDLVVGATGMVGTEVVRQLARRGERVRAFVRPDADVRRLRVLPHVEFAVGDLFDPPSAEAALDGCTHVIATANGAVPRRRRDHRRLERLAYPPLIGAARDHGIQRFVYLSAAAPAGEHLPMQQARRVAEAHLCDSGLEYAIVRAGPLMESWLTPPGGPSSAQEEPDASPRGVRSPKLAARGVGRIEERHGTLRVAGGPHRRLSFISVRDVAAILVAARTHERARDAILEVGGPEPLSWQEMADLHGRLLGRQVTARARPVPTMQVLARVLSPFSPGAANLLSLEVVVAGSDMIVSPEPAADLGVGPLDRVEDYLAAGRPQPTER